MFRRIAPLFVFLVTGTAAQAQIIDIQLIGAAGAGLRPGNEVPAVSEVSFGARGGEIGAGITYNDATNLLTLNIGWGGTGNGNSNGFGAGTQLSGNATAGHIHGFANQTSTAPVLFDLSAIGGTWDTNQSGGGLTGGSVTLTPAQETELFAGNFYINIHTAANPTGEIRANLAPVPEPSLMLALAAGSMVGIRFVRRRFNPVVATA
jgi:hypothetical protein